MINVYKKGRAYEQQKARQFSNFFREHGCKFQRIGMAESTKITALGDIMATKCFQCPIREDCPLSNTFWELANRDYINWEQKHNKSLDDKQHKKTAVLIGKRTHGKEKVMCELNWLLEILWELVDLKKTLNQ